MLSVSIGILPLAATLNRVRKSPRGNKCEFLHEKPQAAAAAKPRAKAKAAAQDKDNPQGRVARFSLKDNICGPGPRAGQPST